MAAEIEFITSVIFLTFLINLNFPFDPNEESEGECLGVAGLAGWCRCKKAVVFCTAVPQSVRQPVSMVFAACWLWLVRLMAGLVTSL